MVFVMNISVTIFVLDDEHEFVVFVPVVVIFVLVVMIFVADKLVGSIARVASVHATIIFETVEALLGGGGQNFVGTIVVGGNEKEEGIAAGVGAAITRTTVLDKRDVGIVTTAVGTVGSGTGRSSFDEGSLYLAMGAYLVEIMEVFLYNKIIICIVT